MKKASPQYDDVFLTSAQASQLLNISVGTLKKYVYQGKIKTLKTPGGHHRFLKEDLLKKLYSTGKKK
ncbi:MAG: helix-turn-helix domain-containing protein [Candidatus Omnitrophica bacterium]|nr:helix-turn-helix domain-containing protein [Candidatus Omnitrophota bacterium]